MSDLKGLAVSETEIADLEKQAKKKKGKSLTKRVEILEKRFEKLIEAIDSSKRVKGIQHG